MISPAPNLSAAVAAAIEQAVLEIDRSMFEYTLRAGDSKAALQDRIRALQSPDGLAALREFGVHVALLSLDQIASGYGVVDNEVRGIVNRVLKGE